MEAQTVTFIYIDTSQPGPGTAREKFDELMSGHFTLHKVFSPVTHLGFRVWGTPGSRGQIGWVILVLRTLPGLVWRSVQNLVEIGSGVKRVHRYVGTNSHFYIYRYTFLTGRFYFVKKNQEVYSINMVFKRMNLGVRIKQILMVQNLIVK